MSGFIRGRFENLVRRLNVLIENVIFSLVCVAGEYYGKGKTYGKQHNKYDQYDFRSACVVFFLGLCLRVGRRGIDNGRCRFQRRGVRMYIGRSYRLLTDIAEFAAIVHVVPSFAVGNYLSVVT